jgi:hypothetical protein
MTRWMSWIKSTFIRSYAVRMIHDGYECCEGLSETPTSTRLYSLRSPNSPESLPFWSILLRNGDGCVLSRLISYTRFEGVNAE